MLSRLLSDHRPVDVHQSVRGLERGRAVAGHGLAVELGAGGDVLSGSWGLTRMGAAGMQEDAETVDERCARMARLRGLTKREEEVMLLLVKDTPFAAIEEELSISNSTLKTHARHIYAKFAVGGRRELAELVGARGAAE